METLSKRTQSLLMNAGIKSLQELSEYTAADLLKFRNFGYKSLQEVEPYLKTFDFTIKSDNTETLANALQQIQKLEAEKDELLEALEVFFPMFTELDSEFGIENPRPREWTETEIATVQKLFDLIQKMKQ